MKESVGQIERVPLQSLRANEFYRVYRKNGRPVILTGVAGNEDTRDLPQLKVGLGERQFIVRKYGEGRFLRPKKEWKKYCELVKMSFAEYAAHIEDGTATRDNMYLAQASLSDTPLGSKANEIFDQISQRTGLSPTSNVNFWLGPAGHTEPLHFDTEDGTLLQIYGSKQIALIPPTQSANLYPFPFMRGGLPPWFSRVYINQPDLEAFPLMEKAMSEISYVTLNPGEALFIPAHWWHEVSAVGQDYTCSLNRFWSVRPILRICQSWRFAILYLLSQFMSASGYTTEILKLTEAK